MTTVRPRAGAPFRLYLTASTFGTYAAFLDVLTAVSRALPADGPPRVTILARTGTMTGHWTGLAGSGESTLITLDESASGRRGLKSGRLAVLVPDVVSLTVH